MTAQRKNLGEYQANQGDAPIDQQKNDGSDRQQICQMVERLINRILVTRDEMHLCLVKIAHSLCNASISPNNFGEECWHDSMGFQEHH